MSTPQQKQHPGRRPSRKPKNGNSVVPGNADQKYIDSDTDSQYYHLSEPPIDPQYLEDKSRQRRKSQPKKRNGGSGEYQQSDQSLNVAKSRATPIKQAYAGPTFHQSPAASALPMPSFYSKSASNIADPKFPNLGTDSAEQSDSTTQKDDIPTKRETTPLDFLFDAARLAKSSPRADSPSANSGRLSVPTRSPTSRSPGPGDSESVFPFELEGGAGPGEDGTSFATPYRERINALRSTRSASEVPKSMAEVERKAKTEALKKFLFASNEQQQQQQKQESGFRDIYDMNNPFNAKAPLPAQPSLNQHVPRGATIAFGSGPSSSMYNQNYAPPNPHMQYFPSVQHYHYNPQNRTSPNRPPSSNLRNVYGAMNEPEAAELSTDNALGSPPISTARRPSTQQGGGIYGMDGQHDMKSARQQTPVKRQTPTAQQLENDLRRVLKLDLTSQG